jgi:hypothetical protein
VWILDPERASVASERELAGAERGQDPSFGGNWRFCGVEPVEELDERR